MDLKNLLIGIAVVCVVFLVVAIPLLWHTHSKRNRFIGKFKVLFEHNNHSIVLVEQTLRYAKRYARAQNYPDKKVQLFRIVGGSEYEVDFSRRAEASVVIQDFFDLFKIFKLPKIPKSSEESHKESLKKLYKRKYYRS